MYRKIYKMIIVNNNNDNIVLAEGSNKKALSDIIL